MPQKRYRPEEIIAKLRSGAASPGPDQPSIDAMAPG
jgi:hypothetical protein